MLAFLILRQRYSPETQETPKGRCIEGGDGLCFIAEGVQPDAFFVCLVGGEIGGRYGRRWRIHDRRPGSNPARGLRGLPSGSG